MKHLDLFSGIGGFALAARWMGWETIQFVEIDKFCQKVLNKNFPNVPIHGDIKTFDGSKYRGTVDILTGGFPCQPFSTAGSRQGKDDARFLWPEMLRVIGEVGPCFVVGENVGGITSMENGKMLERIFVDLESIGFSVEAFLIPAAAVGMPHRRDRVWIVANSIQGIAQAEQQGFNKENRLSREWTSDFTCRHLPTQWDVLKRDSGVSRNGNGVSNWVDRISGTGNAIVPQVAFEIFKAIEQVK